MATFTIQFFERGAWRTVDPAVAGIIPGPIVERHLREYGWSFRHHSPYDIQKYALNTPVRILSDAALLFTGLITRPERSGAPGQEAILYRCESWWYATSLYNLKVSSIPRVVYNARPDDQQHDVNRYQMTVEEILTDAASLVSASVAAFTLANFKVSWPGLVFDDDLDFVPPKTVFDATSLQQAILLLLKWAPDTYLRIDRTTGAFHFQRRPNATTRNLTLANYDTPAGATHVAGVRLNPRLDLVVPQIKLQFPLREEWWECYIDTSIWGATTPDYLLGIGTTVTALNDLQFQVSHRPVDQLIEVLGGGPYNFSLSTGIITFRDHPADFYIRYIAEESQTIYDTGLGGTGYSDYGMAAPILERYLQDLPRLTRKFYIQATDGAWLLCPAFGEAFPDSSMWAAITGATDATVLEIAEHTFSYQLGNATIVLTGIGIRVSSGISGSFVSVVVEDNSGAVTTLADSLWKALRDVRWEGDLPTFKWMPELEVSNRVNLLNTNDTKMRTMAESIYELELDPLQRKTRVVLAGNPWVNLDDLLRVLREKLPPQNFKTSNTSGGVAGGGMKDHKHNSAGGDGGNSLKPKRITMNGGTEADNEIVNGTLGSGVRITSTGLIVGDYPSGDHTIIAATGLQVRKDGKMIQIAVLDGFLQIRIDGNDYLFTASSTRLLRSRIDGS